MEELEIIYNDSNEALIVKKDKSKPWPNNDCSNETLLSYLNKPNNKIDKVRFIDLKGIGDEITIYFK